MTIVAATIITIMTLFAKKTRDLKTGRANNCFHPPPTCSPLHTNAAYIPTRIGNTKDPIKTATCVQASTHSLSPFSNEERIKGAHHKKDNFIFR